MILSDYQITRVANFVTTVKYTHDDIANIAKKFGIETDRLIKEVVRLEFERAAAKKAQQQQQQSPKQYVIKGSFIGGSSPVAFPARLIALFHDIDLEIKGINGNSPYSLKMNPNTVYLVTTKPPDKYGRTLEHSVVSQRAGVVEPNYVVRGVACCKNGSICNHGNDYCTITYDHLTGATTFKHPLVLNPLYHTANFFLNGRYNSPSIADGYASENVVVTLSWLPQDVTLRTFVSMQNVIADSISQLKADSHPKVIKWWERMNKLYTLAVRTKAKGEQAACVAGLVSTIGSLHKYLLDLKSKHLIQSTGR